MGSLQHGLKIFEKFSVLINEFPEFEFAFKLQYRDLDTFIRPDFVKRLDVKHIKRFSETRLSRAHQKELVKGIKANGFKTMCTPFDEISVSKIIEDEFDFLKIASCSCSDWTLLETAVKTSLPIVASIGGASLKDVDNLISFFHNRKKDFVIQHCVGEYPTQTEKMNLNQIDFLKDRYSDVRFGFSTHENPEDTDLIKIAVAKGAESFERHVGVPTPEWPLNQYSSNLDQIRKWLDAARFALTACGKSSERYQPSEEENSALRSLQRGLFSKRDIKENEILEPDAFFLAFPPDDQQLTGDRLSKYNKIRITKEIKKGAPVYLTSVSESNERLSVLEKANKAANLLKSSSVTVPTTFSFELSHHYGLEKFEEVGLSMITLVNREYCKKILVCLPGQVHPEQYHKKKEETFHVLYGSLIVNLDGKKHLMKEGDVLTIFPKMRHEFVSDKGAVIEEISSSHFTNDSFYTDENIMQNKDRKTYINYRLE